MQLTREYEGGMGDSAAVDAGFDCLVSAAYGISAESWVLVQEPPRRLYPEQGCPRLRHLWHPGKRLSHLMETLAVSEKPVQIRKEKKRAATVP